MTILLVLLGDLTAARRRSPENTRKTTGMACQARSDGVEPWNVCGVIFLTFTA